MGVAFFMVLSLASVLMSIGMMMPPALSRSKVRFVPVPENSQAATPLRSKPEPTPLAESAR
jgi:hypothetical protein